MNNETKKELEALTGTCELYSEVLAHLTEHLKQVKFVIGKLLEEEKC